MYLATREISKQNSKLEDEWYKKISVELTQFSLSNSSNGDDLTHLMEKYVNELRTAATYFNKERLKSTLLNHMHCFYQYQLNILNSNNEQYLNKMSEILKIYCSLEIESTTQRNREVSEQMLNVLLLYLFRDHKTMQHFLKKLHSPDLSTPIDFLKFSFLKNIIQSREKNKTPENEEEKQDFVPSGGSDSRSQPLAANHCRSNGEESSETVKKMITLNQDSNFQVANIEEFNNNYRKIKNEKEEFSNEDENRSYCEFDSEVGEMAQDAQNLPVNVLNLSLNRDLITSRTRNSSEFSNSPISLSDIDEIVEQTSTNRASNEKNNCSLFANHSNYCKIPIEILEETEKSNCGPFLPTIVPDTYDFQKNAKNDVFSKIELEQDDSDCETRLPLKKRKLSVANKEQQNEQKIDEEEILKCAKAKVSLVNEEVISYPATRMLNIAELEAEALNINKLKYLNSRPFKTLAECKEMPPLPDPQSNNQSSPIITEQYNNNHTYNNPTINYHMNNVPVPLFNLPYGSYYSLPSIILPFNSMQTVEINGQTQDLNEMKKKQTRRSQKKRR